MTFFRVKSLVSVNNIDVIVYRWRPVQHLVFQQHLHTWLSIIVIVHCNHFFIILILLCQILLFTSKLNHTFNYHAPAWRIHDATVCMYNAFWYGFIAHDAALQQPPSSGYAPPIQIHLWPSLWRAVEDREVVKRWSTVRSTLTIEGVLVASYLSRSVLDWFHRSLHTVIVSGNCKFMLVEIVSLFFNMKNVGDELFLAHWIATYWN